MKRMYVKQELYWMGYKLDEKVNCLFCYCPLYNLEKCPGEYRYIDLNDKKIKDCMNCTFPHKLENYETIMALLGEK